MLFMLTFIPIWLLPRIVLRRCSRPNLSCSPSNTPKLLIEWGAEAWITINTQTCAVEAQKTRVLKTRNLGTATIQTGAPPGQNFKSLNARLGSRLFRGFG